MTVLQTHIFDSPGTCADSAPRLFSWFTVLSCFYISFMFMLATNDPGATGKWEAVSREQVAKLSIALESGRAARQAGFIGLGLWGLAVLLFSRRRFRFNGIYLFPLLVIAGWSYASVLWSGDRSFTLKRLTVFTCLALAVVAFARHFKLRDLALLAFVGCGVQLIGSVIFDLLYAKSEYGLSGYRFSGLQHPNHSGISAMFFIFGCLYLFDRTRLVRFLVLLGAASIIMYLTKSRTSLIAGLAGIAAFAALRWPPRTVFLLGVCGLSALGLFFMLVAMNLVSNDWANVIHMGREDAKATALTGRPAIWAAALEWLGGDYSRLLLGSGYDTFWTPDAATYVSNRVWFRISEGHCAYFDTLLELGVVGVSCYIFLILASLGRYARLAWTNDTGAYAFAAMVLTFALVHGLTESTTVDPNVPTFFSFTCIAALAFRSPRTRIDESEVFT